MDPLANNGTVPPGDDNPPAASDPAEALIDTSVDRLPDLSPDLVHRNILRCHALLSRVHFKLLSHLNTLIEHEFFKELEAPSPVIYVMKYLKYGDTEAGHIVRVARNLGRLVSSGRAFEEGLISWSHMKEISRIASKHPEAPWLKMALTSSVAALRAEVSHAIEKGRAEPRAKRTGLPHSILKMIFRLPAEKHELVRKALEAVIARSVAQRKAHAESAREGDDADGAAGPASSDGANGAGGSGAGAGAEDDWKKPITKEEAICMMAAEALERFADSYPVDPGTRQPVWSVVYHVWPALQESHVMTPDGPVEVPYEHVEEIARHPGTQKLTVGLDEEFVKGEVYIDPDGKTDGEVPAGVELKVLACSDHACAHCGRKLRLHVHHIVFRSKGGPHEVWNLVPICDVCHGFIHNGGLQVFRDSSGRLHWKSRGDTIEAFLRDELKEFASIPAAVLVVEKEARPGPADKSAPANDPARPDGVARATEAVRADADEVARARALDPETVAPAARAVDGAAVPSQGGSPSNGSTAGGGSPGSGNAKAPAWSPQDPRIRREVERIERGMKGLGYSKTEARERLANALRLLAGLDRAPTGDEIFNTAIHERAMVFQARREPAGGRFQARGGAQADEEGEAPRRSPPAETGEPERGGV